MTDPLLPNVSAEQYEADRLTIHRAIGWLPDGRRITLEDWPTAELATAALEIAKHAAPQLIATPHALDVLADLIIGQLEIDPARPFGCAIIVE
jgi:hypothetical protein